MCNWSGNIPSFDGSHLGVASFILKRICSASECTKCCRPCGTIWLDISGSGKIYLSYICIGNVDSVDWTHQLAVTVECLHSCRNERPDISGHIFSERSVWRQRWLTRFLAWNDLNYRRTEDIPIAKVPAD